MRVSQSEARCYKKRLFDGVFVCIGEAVKHEDKEQWDIDFIDRAYLAEEESNKTNAIGVNKYDRDFYLADGSKLDVSENYYRSQLYYDRDFTITTGMIGYMSLPSYYDFFEIPEVTVYLSVFNTIKKLLFK